MDHLGFAIDATRMAVHDHESFSLRLRPTHLPNLVLLDDKIDPGLKRWPPYETEKSRLMFVDLQLPDQTGCFYIGNCKRNPRFDHFLQQEDWKKLPEQVSRAHLFTQNCKLSGE